MEYNFRTLAEYKQIVTKIYTNFQQNFDESLYYKLKIYIKKLKITLTQNRLYWLFLTYIAKKNTQETDKDKLHLLFRAKFLKKTEDENYLYLLNNTAAKLIINNADNFNYTNELALIIDFYAYHTKILKSDKFNQYLIEISQFCSEKLNVILVFPDEHNWDAFFAECQRIK